MRKRSWSLIPILGLLLMLANPIVTHAQPGGGQTLYLPALTIGAAGQQAEAAAKPDHAVKPEQSAKGYLIATAAPLTDAQVAELAQAGANVKYVYKNFGGAAAVLSGKALAKVRALPFVTAVNEDTVKQLDAVTAVAPQAGEQALPGTPYWLDLMDAENNSTSTGAGVWVAVLDSGFYPNWRDYFDESQILTQYGMAFIAANGNPNSNQWDVGSDPHGMAVSATIVGHRFVDDTNEGGWGSDMYATATNDPGPYWVPGVAPDAKIIPVKVCEPIGCFGSAINAGVDYITSLKLADRDQPIVINMSLGGPGLDPTEKAALDAAIDAGVVVVASAGNSGNAGMGFPGAYEPVISVGAGGWTQQWEPDKRWWLKDVPEPSINADSDVDEVYIPSFSSRQLEGQYLDVVSAGRYLLLPYPCAQLYKDGQVSNGTAHRTCASKATPDNSQAAPFQYLFMSGTSFSAPAVAGVVALMLEKNGALNNADAGFGAIDDPNSWGPGSLERLLEGAATDIAPGSVEITHRTDETIIETWEIVISDDPGPGDPGLEATGAGWVLIDDALDAVP